MVPLLGPKLQVLLVGGSEYGHQTLTRFFALHAGVLPAGIVALLAAHLFLFRRHGLTAKEPKRKPDACFWPDQVLKDAVACLAVLAAVLFLVLRPWLFQTGESPGAELGAPADPSEPYSAARPEWYFLFLFQFLKYFPGGTEVWGAVVIPTVVMMAIFLMPIVGRWNLGHRFNVGLLCALFAGAALLAWQAVSQDKRDPTFQAAQREAQEKAARVKTLAQSPAGIPRDGAVTLLQQDPLTQGPKLFSRNCGNCHRFGGHDGTGKIPKEPQSASDLQGFASREWLAGLLDPERVSTTNYFGATKFADGKMARFVKKDLASLTPEQKGQVQKVIVALSAEAQLKSQRAADQRAAALIDEGKKLIASPDLRCTECHQFHKPDEDATAPDLTGFGSREWLTSFIANPKHARFYGKRNDRMPAYGDDQILNPQAIRLLADWLRGDWYEPAR
jgi:ubiquinol-cytochrome c reductase cytochrome b subunit